MNPNGAIEIIYPNNNNNNNNEMIKGSQADGGRREEGRVEREN